jgi:hypothetical protein
LGVYILYVVYMIHYLSLSRYRVENKLPI